jgi:hypothetical protein
VQKIFAFPSKAHMSTRTRTPARTTRTRAQHQHAHTHTRACAHKQQQHQSQKGGCHSYRYSCICPVSRSLSPCYCIIIILSSPAIVSVVLCHKFLSLLHYFRTCAGNFDGGGDWYPGKIVAIRHQTGGGGRVTYDIVYDDGRKRVDAVYGMGAMFIAAGSPSMAWLATNPTFYPYSHPNPQPWHHFNSNRDRPDTEP